jgi:uncharacterized Fe-S cluster-containing protein
LSGGNQPDGWTDKEVKMTQGYKFKTKFNGKVSVRALCEDCLKESVYETVVAGIYSDTSSISAAELAVFAFPSCDVCDATFTVATVAA